MKLSRLLFIPLFLALALQGCRQDDSGFIPSETNTETMSSVDLTGFVIDTDGNPISGATVLYDLVQAMTDDNGYYIIQDVQASSEHASFQVTKSGYFTGSRTFRTSNTGTVFHRTTLVPLGTPLSFSGGNGSVANNLVSIDFPENSVIDESTGELYTGNVDVYINHIGTDEFSMPGDLTSINENDELEVLHSYGMVFVEMYAEDGRKLNVADGMTASLTYEIPQELLPSAPETIKMWWYDYDAGLWREGGQATRIGSKWKGEVSHFSCWNFDLNVPSILVKGKIVQSNGGTSRYYVSFLNDNGQGGRGSANSDGSFSGRVEAGVPLEFTILYNEPNCDTIIVREIIGPFNQDVDLGEIIVDISNFPSKPRAAFVINQDATQLNKYFFTNTSSVGVIADDSFTSMWDFGGDGTSTDESPSHTFSSTGFHDITLTITAVDGEVSTITQSINVGGNSNKFARITDTKDDDTGELRLSLGQSVLNGKVSFRFRVSEGSSMDIQDAFINVAGTATTGDFSITELRFKDNTIHEFREGASDNTIAAANFPMGVADVWVPVEISWNGDGVTVPLYSVTIGGQSVVVDAVSTTNGGPGDVAGHLDAVVNGAMNFQWKYAANSLVSDGRYDVDDIKVFSINGANETIVFEDNFEGRIAGQDLNPIINPNSPYMDNSSDASVWEDF